MDWNRGPIIGRGSTAAVSIATSLASGEQFAIKSADLSKSAPLQREQTLLLKMTSGFIIKYLGHQVTVENNIPTYNLLMEYASGGSLHDEIKRRGGRLDEPEIRSYTRDILMGLEYLHGDEVGLAHCDIKSQNVLLVTQGRAKIADLGCARPVHGGGWADTSAFSGTPAFMSPEVARGEGQGREVDIWALGCTVIEMATGKRPWDDGSTNVDPVAVLYRIGFSGEIPELPEWFSETGKDFLSKCLRREAKERWTAKELLAHPFVGEIGQPEGNVDRELTVSWSPSCVLDQGFWSSVESPHEDIKWVGTNIKSDACDHWIKRLIGLGGDTNLSDDLDADDVDWITVRSNNFDAEDRPVSGSSTLLVQNSIVDEVEESHFLSIGDFLFFEDFTTSSSSISDIDVSCRSGEIDGFVLGNLGIDTDNDISFSFSQSLTYLVFLNFHLIFMGYNFFLDKVNLISNFASNIDNFYLEIESGMHFALS